MQYVKLGHSICYFLFLVLNTYVLVVCSRLSDFFCLIARLKNSSLTFSVSELLEKHGLERPVSFVKNTQSSSEEARKLMVRLTRHTGRK